MPEVKLSNPDKVLFPEDGITKAELAEHYARVAELMVPHCKDRPMNLWRWNKGIDHDVVVQQSLPKGAPDWVARCEVPRRKGGDIVHGMINDADTLRWLAQQNCITPHVWNSRCDKRDSPDRIVFDLDPDRRGLRPGARGRAGGGRAAARIRPRAVREGLGSRGIHIIAPLKRTRTADEIRAGSQVLADRVAEENPDTLTTAWRKEKRGGRILVDVARNTYGQTVVAPYAVRALPGAPVAMPVTWEEVADPALHPQQFKLREIADRHRARRPLGGDERGREGVSAGLDRVLTFLRFALDRAADQAAVRFNLRRGHSSELTHSRALRPARQVADGSRCAPCLHRRHRRARPASARPGQCQRQAACTWSSVEPLAELGTARAKFNENRAFTNNHILETAPAAKAELESKIEANNAVVDKNLAAVEKSLATDEGKRMFASLRTHLEGLPGGPRAGARALQRGQARGGVRAQQARRRAGGR